ncbi:MAG: 5-formyltetrahydrofolate cyclo-ligase [Pseudomonadota bacterium]
MQSTPDELRQQMRKMRAEIPNDQLHTSAQLVFQNVTALDAYQNAMHIAAYAAINGEIDLRPVIEHAWNAGKCIYLPILDEIDLRFAPYFPDSPMRTNRFKLQEPDVPDSDMRPAHELDLVLAPLVVFDSQRNRIGMGGGYYDRTFEFRRTTDAKLPTLIGVAHETQRVDSLVPEEWDVRLDAVVTDQHIYA